MIDFGFFLFGLLWSASFNLRKPLIFMRKVRFNLRKPSIFHVKNAWFPEIGGYFPEIQIGFLEIDAEMLKQVQHDGEKVKFNLTVCNKEQNQKSQWRWLLLFLFRHLRAYM